MTRQFAVVYEADADFETATHLADQVLLEDVDWLDGQLDAFRTWEYVNPAGARLTWKNIKNLARDAGIRVHGHFDGKAGLPDASAARRAIEYVQKVFPDIGLSAIVLVRDQDDQADRWKGLEQARMAINSDTLIVIGLAVIERESWVISGFEPVDDEELATLITIRGEIGFDPRLRSHDLTAGKDDTANKSPKRVLQRLTGGDAERERRCWRDTPLQLLRDRGAQNGLAAFLQEVRDRLAPLFVHIPAE